MDIAYVQTFLALCKYKKMSTASEHLNISQQGISRQIQTLESVLNIDLFNRTRSGVTLTEHGRLLQPYFEKLFNDYNDLLKNIDICNKGNNILRIGFSHGVSSALGVEFIREYKRIHDDLRIDVIERYDEECYEQLINNEIDIALLVEPFSKAKLNCTRIFTDMPYALININHPYAKTKKQIYVKDLDKQPILTGSKEFILRKTFDRICLENGFEPNIIFSGSSVSSYINLVKETEAIAIIVNFMNQYVQSDSVVSVPLVDGPIYNVSVCMLKSNKNPNAASLHNFIIKHFMQA